MFCTPYKNAYEYGKLKSIYKRSKLCGIAWCFVCFMHVAIRQWWLCYLVRHAAIPEELLWFQHTSSQRKWRIRGSY